VISSDDLTNGDLVIAEILLEMAVEQGSTEIRVGMDELGRRVRAKGYDPNTGEPLH
jgi:asparagine synthetase A